MTLSDSRRSFRCSTYTVVIMCAQFARDLSTIAKFLVPINNCYFSIISIGDFGSRELTGKVFVDCRIT